MSEKMTYETGELLVFFWGRVIEHKCDFDHFYGRLTNKKGGGVEGGEFIKSTSLLQTK